LIEWYKYTLVAVLTLFDYESFFGLSISRKPVERPYAAHSFRFHVVSASEPHLVHTDAIEAILKPQF